MRRYRPYVIALGAIAVWGVFAHAYLGVEDGSSGLSPLGWIHVGFFLPGLRVFRMFNDSYSNSDIPLIAAISWLLFIALALSAAHVTVLLNRRKERKSNKKTAAYG
jgi:hypothetical protein